MRRDRLLMFLLADGLAHYALAPVSAHTPMMNLSIWVEAATATALLFAVFQRRIE